MNFAWPYALWLLVVPLALLAYDGARRRRTAKAGAPQKMLRGEADARQVTLATGPAPRQFLLRRRVWLGCGLILAIIALGRPQWGREQEQVFDQSREILIAMDLSRSMLAPDVKPSRLERAKLLTQSLLERLAGERVGLVVFSGTAFLQSPLSADYEILRDFLPVLGPDYLPEGGTDYHALLKTSLDAFASTNSADRYLIILSDGEAHDDNWRDLLPELKEKNIRVLSLGIGTALGAMIPDGAGGLVKDARGAVVLSRLENGTLQQLASDTGGAYRDASSWVDLPALLRQTVETGQQGQFAEKRLPRLLERFQWFLAPALCCLLLSFWREMPVRPHPRAIALAGPAPVRQPPAKEPAA